VHLLALSFKAHTTLRLHELAWLAVAIGGILLMAGSVSKNYWRGGQLFGGLAIAIGGIIAILATHYGK
jgi:phage-related minor tail protein